MLPSRRLVILVLAAAPIFLAGALHRHMVVVAVLYLTALSLCALLDLLLVPGRKTIAVEREAPERLSLGEWTRIVLDVRNLGRRQVALRLAEDLPESMEARAAELHGVFDARAHGRMEYRLRPRRRGRYLLSAIDVRARSVVGLVYRQFRVELPSEVQVFPNLVDVQRYDLLVRRGLSTMQGLARQRRIGQGSEFESLRVYTPGDEMARVDWKATAKRSKLVVKNFQPEREQSVLVAIDVGRATAGEFAGVSRLDYLINAALMLAYVVLRQGDWFSLLAFSDRIESYLPPVRRLQSIDRVARALFELEPRLTEANYGAACGFLGLRQRKRSLICLMTDVIDKQASEVVLGYLARFARRHLPLAIALGDPEVLRLAREPLSRTSDPYSKAVALDALSAREEALTTMRHQGVDVLDVTPDKLTPDLINRYLLIKSTRRL